MRQALSTPYGITLKYQHTITRMTPPPSPLQTRFFLQTKPRCLLNRASGSKPP